MHPVIEEINRAKGPSDVRDTAFKRWQETLRTDVQARLDRADALEQENAELRKQIGRRTKAEAA